MEELYYRVNRDLTIEVAKKAKKENVKQFIFMSSIIVYGKKSTENGVINERTVPIPDNFYGKSKLEAEEKLNEIKRDRKSTRLNSSHVAISYAVFCLKKKK